MPDRSVEQLKPKWAQPPSQFIEIAGLQIHLRDEGPREDPTPIVLLHGTSSSLHTWDGWVNALKDERQVIRFDLPGFGLTGPTVDSNYSIENYCRIVVEVLDMLKVDRAILVGNSLGGYVSWATAVFYPDRVAKLVLIDSSGYPFEAKSIPIGFSIASTPILNKLMQQVLPRGMVESSVKNVYGNPESVTPELVSRYFDLTTRTGNRQALVERLQQIRPGQLVPRISELNLSTLIIWGQQDRLIPPDIADRFHRDIIGSQLVRFNELGHVPQEEDPHRTVNAFKAFLTQQTQD
ncbi:alpha/beta fold hydrolase [Shewanella sp. OMA3-2]|uniref:alpha/beta fold hydrolase n=1 Tax=Shewanella sp. OMA3-2 TaxID=2908650 RepID=UPI001F3E436A|nr:alpha/beta hydrolase [Shewanella sp. OMA3-2]UJF20859.1 alpha/beta hydrolase [Shewanella sp. OMA3-2]